MYIGHMPIQKGFVMLFIISLLAVLAVVILLTVVCVWGSVNALHRRHESPRIYSVEKIIRFLAVELMIVSLAITLAGSIWANHRGTVVRHGRVVWNVSSSVAYTVSYVFIALAVATFVLFGIASLLKHRRINKESADYFKIMSVVRSEYDKEEAERIIKRTGLRERWRRHFDDFGF
jgi:flagellar biosynthesis protein FlhB